MKVYNINVYSVNHYGELGTLGKCYGKAIIKRGFFGGLTEIMTGKTIFINKDADPESVSEVYSNLHFREYEKYGKVLAVKAEDLNDHNLATMKSVNNYIEKYEDTKIREAFGEMGCPPVNKYKQMNLKLKLVKYR